MTTDDPFRLLERALDQTGALVASVRPEQAGLPTPCTAFDVRELVNHTVYDVRLFATMVTGGERQAPGADLIGDDWPGAYRTASESLMDTWRKRGAEGTLKTAMGELPPSWAVGQQVADLACHAWDIARATGQPTAMDLEIGQAALDWVKQNLKPEYRGETFGPEVKVPDTLPVYDRLAAFFGRDPG